MIPVTPIAGLTILLDVDAVVAIEATPETVIALDDGRRMVVADSVETLVRRIARCRGARIASAAEPHVVDAARQPAGLRRLDDPGA